MRIRVIPIGPSFDLVSLSLLSEELVFHAVLDLVLFVLLFILVRTGSRFLQHFFPSLRLSFQLLPEPFRGTLPYKVYLGLGDCVCRLHNDKDVAFPVLTRYWIIEQELFPEILGGVQSAFVRTALSCASGERIVSSFLKLLLMYFLAGLAL